MSAAGNDNSIDENINANIIFTIKDTKLYVPVVTLSARDNRKLSKILSKGFERSVYWNECKTKQKVRIKMQQMNINIFWNKILVELIDCLSLFKWRCWF